MKLEEKNKIMEWINVDNELPEVFVNCLVAIKTGELMHSYPTIAFRVKHTSGGWIWQFEDKKESNSEVYAWQNLPEPPK